MAIAFDATTYEQAFATSSITKAHTCTGNDRFIVVVTGGQNSVASGVTYGGIAMTQFGTSLNPATNRRINSWYLVAPPSGANNVVATFSGSTGWHYIEVTSYTGVDPLNPVITSGDKTGTGTTATIDFTTTSATQWGVYGITYNTATASAGTRSYERQDNTELAMYDSNSTLPSGSTDMNTSLSSSVAWGANYIVIQPTQSHTVSADLSTNLVSYWELEETSGTRYDATATNNDLTDNNTVTSTTGVQGTGADFTSANSEFLSGTKVGTTGSAGTYNMWVYINDTSEKGTFLEDGGDGGGTNGVAIGVGSGNLDTNGNNLLVPFWGVDWQDTGVTLGTGWHMVTVVLGTDKKAKVYKDGTLVFTGTATYGTLNTGFYLGKSNNNTSFYRYFDGALDEVGAWTRALSAGEIAALYNGGTGIPYESATTIQKVKTFNTIANASIKTLDTIAKASLKTISTIGS